MWAAGHIIILYQGADRQCTSAWLPLLCSSDTALQYELLLVRCNGAIAAWSVHKVRPTLVLWKQSCL